MIKHEIIEKFSENSIETVTKHLNIYENTITEHKQNIKHKNGDILFCINIYEHPENEIYNIYKYINDELHRMKLLDRLFPDTFNWIFDGKNIRTLTLIKSSDKTIQGLISRYGGTINLVKTLKRHILNVAKANTGISVNYIFDETEQIDKYITSLGSINNETTLYSVMVDSTMSTSEIVRKATIGETEYPVIPNLNIHFWKRQVNPDLVRSTRPGLSVKIPVEFSLYPICLNNLMCIKDKTETELELMIVMLLNIHTVRDAKHVLKTVLSDTEFDFITKKSDKAYLPYIINNLERYTFPSCKVMEKFCNGPCELSHPLEIINKNGTSTTI